MTWKLILEIGYLLSDLFLLFHWQLLLLCRVSTALAKRCSQILWMYLVPFDNHLWLLLQWSHIKKQNWNDAPERFHQSRTDSHPGIHTITSLATHLRSVSFKWYAVRFILLSFHIFSGFTFILKKKKKERKRKENENYQHMVTIMTHILHLCSPAFSTLMT